MAGTKSAFAAISDTDVCKNVNVDNLISSRVRLSLSLYSVNLAQTVELLGSPTKPVKINSV